MSSDERMLMQIFERRDSIIERVKQQTEMYTQLLASKLLNEGIDPPSWLWKPDSASNSKDLNKEEFITRVLCPNPKPPVQYSVAKFPMYNNLVCIGDYEGGNSTGGVAFSEAPDGEEDASAGPVQRVEDLERCASHSRKNQIKQKSSDRDMGTSEPTGYIKPKKEPQSYSKLIKSGSIVRRSMTIADTASNISDSQEKALSSIQRSKSRQRALEIRNIMKKLSESGLSRQEINDISSDERKLAPSASGIGNENENLKSTGPCEINFQSYDFRDVDGPNFLSTKTGKVSDLILDVKDSDGYAGQNMIPAGPSVSYSQKCTENINDAEQSESPRPQCSYSVDKIPLPEMPSLLCDIGDMNAAASSGRSAQHVNDSGLATDDEVITSQTRLDFRDESETGEHDEILKSRSASLVDELHMDSDRQVSDEQNDISTEDDVALDENSTQLGISCSTDASSRDDIEQPDVSASSGKLLSCEIVDDHRSSKGASSTPAEDTNCSLKGLTSPSIERETVFARSENVSSAYNVPENIDVKSVEPLLKTSETKSNALSHFEEREPSSARVQRTLTGIECEPSSSDLCDDFPPGDAAVSLSETIIESSSERKVTKTGNHGGLIVPQLTNNSLGVDERNEGQDDELCIFFSPEQSGMLIQDGENSFECFIENFTSFDPSNDCFLDDARRLDDDAEFDPKSSILEMNDDSRNFEKSAHESPHSDSGIAQYLDISSIQGIDTEETIGCEQGIPSSGFSKYASSPRRMPKGRCSKSSEKKKCCLSKPEFACFPIHEDPSEENFEVADDTQEASLADDFRRPLDDLTNLNSEGASSEKATDEKGKDRNVASMGDFTTNNVVTNIRSFLPLIQKNQPSTFAAGKREVKIKALEAAEAAKRQEEKRENERRLKKEALKLERAKMEEAKSRQRELRKTKREEELKEKEAEIVAKKRAREELDERKREDKRLRLERAQRRREHDEKGKQQQQHKLKDERLQIEAKNRDVSAAGDFGSKKMQSKSMHAEHEIADKSTRKENMIGQGTSYEISPYQSSDDEEEENEEDESGSKKKSVPSWASKNNVGVLLSLQQNMDPMTIFPRESFCDVDEVIHRRRK